MTDMHTISPLNLGVPRHLAKRLFPSAYNRFQRAEYQRARALWNNELYGIIGKILAESGFYVRSGPFAGMMYWPVGKPGYMAGGTASSLLGLYELELHDVIEELIACDYDQVINVGCADGYYAVGLARRLQQAHVYAFDIDGAAREACKSLADVNNVSERVTVGGECTKQTLQESIGPKCLIFCDCEGGEVDLLDPASVPALAQSDILVELHDVFYPGLSEDLLPKFSATHNIDIISTQARDPNRFPELGFLTVQEIAMALDERRPGEMTWAIMRSRKMRDEIAG